jgi:signal transduction protein with GAF and PtsI domain
MAETELIRRMADDVASLKEQMNRLEIVINEIDQDIHREVNPQYLKKLEKIQKQKGIKFDSAEEFDAYFSD